jgi:hypothetical protein
MCRSVHPCFPHVLLCVEAGEVEGGGEHDGELLEAPIGSDPADYQGLVGEGSGGQEEVVLTHSGDGEGGGGGDSGPRKRRAVYPATSAHV